VSRRARGIIGAAVVVAAALTLGCAQTADRHGNDVRMVIYAEPSSLSLVGNTDNNSSLIAGMISDGLVAYDARGNFVPMVAASWDIAPDALTITFRLRAGVLWQDGTPLTSHDVAFTLRKVRDPAVESRSWVSLFADVTGLETPDERTVIVHYSRPYADALDAWRVPLLPEHLASKDADFLNGEFARHPVGCGPFRFVSREPGQNVILEAFDRYWQGRPQIDRLVVRIVASDRTGYEALLLGDVDLMAVPSDLWRESLSSHRAARLARFVYYRLMLWKVDWNQDGSNPYFTDPRVRRALVSALDRKRFAAAVVNGLARPAAGSYLPESAWTDPSIAPIPFDPAEAGRLLDEAGWRLAEPGGLRVKDGKPLAFTVLVAAGSQELADRIAAWMQESVRAVGVAMKVEKVEWRAFQERRKTHRFEAAMASNIIDPTPDQFDLYHSSARNGGFNYGGFSDPETDRLLEAGRMTIDPAARRAIYWKLQARLHELEPMSVLFQFSQPVLHDPNLLGVVASPVGLYGFTPGPRAWHWAGATPSR
jgi:peptide/nickel transport system substrate-binding protein